MHLFNLRKFTFTILILPNCLLPVCRNVFFFPLPECDFLSCIATMEVITDFLDLGVEGIMPVVQGLKCFSKYVEVTNFILSVTVATVKCHFWLG